MTVGLAQNRKLIPNHSPRYSRLLYFPSTQNRVYRARQIWRGEGEPHGVEREHNRWLLKQMGAAGALALTAANAETLLRRPRRPPSPAESAQAATRTQRMAWWHQARFGMFIHWGLYSVIGQHEWAKQVEGIPCCNTSCSPSTSSPSRTPPAIGRGWPRRRARSTW